MAYGWHQLVFSIIIFGIINIEFQEGHWTTPLQTQPPEEKPICNFDLAYIMRIVQSGLLGLTCLLSISHHRIGKS